MPKEFSRWQRVSQEIRKKIAIIIHYEIRDPRINKMITISRVDISRDLKYAKIYVSFLSNESTALSTIKLLQKASGFIRALLCKTVRLQVIPELVFVYDNSLIEGIKLSNLIDSLYKK